jgi:hypothetical protein
LSVVFSQYSYSNAWSEIQILKEEWMNEWMNGMGGAAKGGIDETNCGDTTWGNACVIWKLHKSSRKTFPFMIHEHTMDHYAIELALKASIIERRCFTISKAIASHLAS